MCLRFFSWHLNYHEWTVPLLIAEKRGGAELPFAPGTCCVGVLVASSRAGITAVKVRPEI